MSGMNYVDGGFVFEDVHQLARDYRGKKVIISWLPESTAELFPLTARVRKCIEYYRKALPEHLVRHGVDREALVELRTEVYVAENRMYVRACAVDSRAKEYDQLVWV